MKEIKAIFRPDRLDAVLDALHGHPELPGVTVSIVRGFGRAVGSAAKDEQAPVQYGNVDMAKLECVVNDDRVDVVVGTVQTAACTHNAGDGKIFVRDVPEAIDIRTGARVRQIEQVMLAGVVGTKAALGRSQAALDHSVGSYVETLA